MGNGIVIIDMLDVEFSPQVDVLNNKDHQNAIECLTTTGAGPNPETKPNAAEEYPLADRNDQTQSPDNKFEAEVGPESEVEVTSGTGLEKSQMDNVENKSDLLPHSGGAVYGTNFRDGAAADIERAFSPICLDITADENPAKSTSAYIQILDPRETNAQDVPLPETPEIETSDLLSATSVAVNPHDPLPPMFA